MASGAFALSTVVFSPVFSGMLEKLNISRTLLIMGIVLGVIGLIATILIKSPSGEYTALKTPKVNSLSYSDTSLSLGQAIRTIPFWIIFLCEFFYNASWNVLTPLIKGLGIERGLTAAAAVLCLSLTGVFNALGRILMAVTSDKIGRIPAMLILGALNLLSAASLVFAGGSLYFAAVLVAAFAFGGPAAIFPAITTDIFGPRYSGRNYGFLICGLGVSSVCANAASNALFKATGSYNASFIMAAACAVVCIILLIILKNIKKMTKNRV